MIIKNLIVTATMAATCAGISGEPAGLPVRVGGRWSEVLIIIMIIIMNILVIRSSIIIITCREGCWHIWHSMFWTSSSLLRQCQTLVGILIIFCHLSVHLFRFFLDDPAKSLWWYFGDDDGHDDKDDTFVSSMTATKLLRELIPNFPVPLQPDASHNHWRNQHNTYKMAAKVSEI